KLNAAGDACVAKQAADWTTRETCAAHDGYWYDAADADVTTPAEFAALKPSCHASALDACPNSGSVPIALHEDDNVVLESVSTQYLYYQCSDIAQMASSLRCLQVMTYPGLSGNSELEDVDLRPFPDLLSVSVS